MTEINPSPPQANASHGVEVQRRVRRCNACLQSGEVGTECECGNWIGESSHTTKTAIQEMKRSPLKRRTPLKRKHWKQRSEFKRKSGQLKRTKLSPVSRERAMWNERYRKARKALPEILQCACCSLARHKNGMEFHHPFARLSERILAFLPLCPKCHHLIHDEGAQSTALGWLQAEFRGMPAINERRFPWPEIYEEHWPDDLKRKNLHPNE